MVAMSDEGMQDSLAHRLVDPLVMSSLQSSQSWIAATKKNVMAVAFFNQQFQNGIEATKRAVAAGVPILAGSDAGNVATFHGPALLRELEILVLEVGMTLEDVLMAATSRAADQFGRQDLGRIQENAIADMIVLDADPMVDIAAYRALNTVYLNGKKLDLETLFDSSPGSWRPSM